MVLVGNSGGAALMSFYQAQAESLTAVAYPDGLPTHLAADDLPPADGLIFSAAHAGRARLLAQWLDPSVMDEADPLAADPAWDIYADDAGTLTPEYLAEFRKAQLRRRDRIQDW